MPSPVKAVRILAALVALSDFSLANASETVWIPMKVSSLFGGERTIKLEATLYRPEGSGPFPLVLYSHTSTGAGKIPATMTLRPDQLAAMLTARGIAVLAPMRRGRGASDGSYDEPYTCNFGAHDAGLRNAIEDTDAAIAFARTQAFIDAGRIVLIGASRGGIMSIVYAARRPGVALGAVSLVGAWTSDSCSNGFHESVFADAGAAAKTPTLWLYAENDSLLSTAEVRRYATEYENAGGRLQLHVYPFSGRDGHFFYLWSPQLYRADLESFLDMLGLKPRP